METYVIATVGKLVELSFAKDVFLRYATRHASCFPGCLAEHRRVTIRKRMRLEKKKMDEKNARVDIKRGSVRSMLERCSTLMDSTYYTYHTRCISYAPYDAREKLDEILFVLVTIERFIVLTREDWISPSSRAASMLSLLLV